MRYFRAQNLAFNALVTLAETRGSYAERLKKIDPEFFSIDSSGLPDVDNTRSLHKEIRRIIKTSNPNNGEGQIAAAWRRVHWTTAKKVVENIIEIASTVRR